MNPLNGVPRALPLSSNLTPSLLRSSFFSMRASTPPTPSGLLREILPLKPPRELPVARTRWQGTPGAKGFFLRALPTARGEDFRCVDIKA